MNNHNNNIYRQPLRLANDAYAWYNDDSRVIWDMISPPSPSFPPMINERVDTNPWLWSLEDRNFTLPSSMTSFLQPPMHLVVLRNNLANHMSLMSRQMERPRTRDSNDQTKALEKLRKEIYNPIPKKMIQRLGKFYKQKDDRKTVKVNDEEEDDDSKRCAICLEELEPKQVVMVTPCNHTFHDQCILPWVKTHGKCPICRFSFCEKTRESGESSS